jgi:dolichol-phosphate mannosyltransferase
MLHGGFRDMRMFNRLLKNKKFRYITLGGVTAAFNLATIFLIIKCLNINTALLRNIANISAIEVSLFFSFFVYRFGVWRQTKWELKKILFRQLPLYHLSSSSTLALRGFIVFPLLEWMGIDYMANTLIGIVVGTTLSYFFNDRIVFTNTPDKI